MAMMTMTMLVLVNTLFLSATVYDSMLILMIIVLILMVQFQ